MSCLLRQVGREDAGLAAQAVRGVGQAERVVSVGLAGVVGDLVAQDVMHLAGAKLAPGGLGGPGSAAGAGDTGALPPW
jgi:hypothetical protein